MLLIDFNALPFFKFKQKGFESLLKIILLFNLYRIIVPPKLLSNTYV